MLARDFPIIQAVILVFSVAYVLVNLAIDLLGYGDAPAPGDYDGFSLDVEVQRVLALVAQRLRAGARLTLPDTGTASVPSRREASAWLRQALQEADGERAAHRPAEAAPAPAGRPAPGAGVALTLVGPRAGQDAASARATGDAGVARVAGDKDEAADAAATAATEQALADAEQERARLLGDRKRLQARVAELTAQAEQDDQRLQVLDDRLAAFEAGAGEARAAEGAADARAAEVQAGEIQAGPTDEDARRAAAERTLQWMLAGLLILLLLIALWLRQRSVEAGQADEDKPEGPVAFDQPPETPQTLAAVDALAAGQQEAVVAHEPESAQDAPAVAQSAFAPDAATLPVDTTPADDGFAPLPEVPESVIIAVPGQQAVEAVERVAPFRHLVTPGGFRMSVAMTNCGAAGWVTDRTGYRYQPHDPQSGVPWPAMAVHQVVRVVGNQQQGAARRHGSCRAQEDGC